MSKSVHRLTALLFFLALAQCVNKAQAVSIGAVDVLNTSSADDFTEPSLFQTQGTLSTVTSTPTSASFNHRMAFFNGYTANGGVAQTNKRNVTYQIDFTVEDPSNLGFEVSAESLLRGISSITQATTGATAVATGASFGVEFDDSTDAPDTWINVFDLFNDVDGTSISGAGSTTFTGQNTESAFLGAYVGTTTISLRFSTVFTPTTNVFFQNGMTGFGEVDYGLGTLADLLAIDSSDLGHFVNVHVTFVPEPNSFLLLGLGLAALGIGRARLRR